MLAGLSSSAVIPGLPASAVPDTEVSTNLALRSWDTNVRTFTLTLELTASASNNVQVAFGYDRSGDGDLAPDETGFVLGWDCGAWFMMSADDRFTAQPPGSASRKTLTFALRLDAAGTPTMLTVKDGNTALVGFPVAGAVPSWLYSPAWNRMKVTARGVDPAAESLRVSLLDDGVRIILR